MKILIISATSLEINPLSEYLERLPTSGLFSYQLGSKTIQTLVTGVGGIKTTYGMATFPQIKDFNLLINVGIAGVYDHKFNVGDVVEVVSDRFGDIGVEENNGDFSSVFALGLDNANQFPFKNEVIENYEAKYKTNLPKANSVSFNTVSGSLRTIEQRVKIGCDIESMEGAAFAYASKYLQIPYLQIRSISNNVEPRDKSKWQMNKAIDNLNSEIIKLIEGL